MNRVCGGPWEESENYSEKGVEVAANAQGASKRENNELSHRNRQR